MRKPLKKCAAVVVRQGMMCAPFARRQFTPLSKRLLSLKRIYRNVIVSGRGSLAKIGMKCAAHLKKKMPVLEDALAGVAFLITKDDAVSPTIRLDCLGKHHIGAGSSQQAIMTSLIVKPLTRIGMKS